MKITDLITYSCVYDSFHIMAKYSIKHEKDKREAVFINFCTNYHVRLHLKYRREYYSMVLEKQIDRVFILVNERL